MTGPSDTHTGANSDSIRRLECEGFQLGPWHVEPRRRRITSDRDARQVDPRSMDVLVQLVARAGEVVTRDELSDAVWADTFVTDNTVSQAVSRLRKALGEDRQRPRFIETISKSGYRLLAEVRPTVGATGGGTPAAPTPLTTRATEPRAVLPSRAPPRGANRRRGPIALLALVAVAALVATLAGLASRSDRPVPAAVTPELTLVGPQFEPVLSPSGARIAFCWRPDDRSPWSVWLKDVGGHQPVRLTDGDLSERLPAWAPDGGALAYARFSEETGPAGIYRTSVIGGATERLADCPAGLRALAWSPAADILALSISGENGGPAHLEILELASGKRRVLTVPPDGTIGDRAPAFSPNGGRIAFERRHSRSRHDVMVIDVAGGAPAALTRDPWGQLRGVAWKADGSGVIYASNRSGQFRLWQVPTGGGDSVRLPIEDTWVTQPSVSRDGGRLIYRAFRDVIDMWSQPLHGRGLAAGSPVRMLASTRSEQHPSWSPDGTSIAFLSDRSGAVEVWSGRSDGTGLMRHTDFSGPLPSAPAWAPDGTRLVFDAAAHGHGDLWTVGSDSRRPVRLTTDDSEDRNSVYSRDGRWIYFASDRSGAWDIWRMPSGGGPPSRVTADGAFRAQESMDGRFIYFAKLDQPGIWRMPARGGTPEVAVDDLSLSDWGSWEVGREGIYFVRRGPTTIRFLDFTSGEVRTVITPAKQIPFLGRSLSLSPDGRSLAFTMIDRSDDEVMRVDMPTLALKRAVGSR